LVDQLEEPVPVLPDQPQPRPKMIGRFCFYLIGHAQNNRQGRSEFMCYIGIKPGFHIRQLLNARFLRLFDFGVRY
jgi:hypothetical protein